MDFYLLIYSGFLAKICYPSDNPLVSSSFSCLLFSASGITSHSHWLFFHSVRGEEVRKPNQYLLISFFINWKLVLSGIEFPFRGDILSYFTFFLFFIHFFTRFLTLGKKSTEKTKSLCGNYLIKHLFHYALHTQRFIHISENLCANKNFFRFIYTRESSAASTGENTTNSSFSVADSFLPFHEFVSTFFRARSDSRESRVLIASHQLIASNFRSPST